MTNLEKFLVILGNSPDSRQMFDIRAPGSLCVYEFKKLVYVERQNWFKGLDAANPAVIDNMRRVEERRFTQVLLARFLLLNLLVQQARELPWGLREKEHRRLWVLLQAHPKIFSPNIDIFTKLTQLLGEADAADLSGRLSP